MGSMEANRRIAVPARTPWAGVVGYARAVRVGPLVEVSGTLAVDGEGRVVAPGDPEGQAAACLRIIGAALEDAGASFEDVVRTRVFLADMRHWQAVGRAHGSMFADRPPASTFVEVSGLLDDDFLVEIEATAFVCP